MKVINVLDNRSKKILNTYNSSNIITKNNDNEPKISKDYDVINTNNIKSTTNDNYDMLNFKKLSSYNINNVNNNNSVYESEKITDINTIENNNAMEKIKTFNENNNFELLNKYKNIALNNDEIPHLEFYKEGRLRKFFNIASIIKLSNSILGLTKNNKTFHRKYMYAYLNEAYEQMNK